jgi:hypothetical protein
VVSNPHDILDDALRIIGRWPSRCHLPHSSQRSWLRSKDLVEVIPKTDLADAGYRKRPQCRIEAARRFSGSRRLKVILCAMIKTTGPQKSHGRGNPSYSSGSLPANNASAVSPNIIMLTVQSRPFILTMNPSYCGLTFEKLVIVIATRRDTLILLSVIRVT